jgi:CheY-like chemotaxis protein
MSCITPPQELRHWIGGESEPTLVAVLSDINMPGMDGLQLLVEIKQRFPDLPVTMVTAYDDDERRRQAAEYGAEEFLTKPVDFERLNAQLGQLPSAPDCENSPFARMTAYRPHRQSPGPGQTSPSGQEE